MKKLITVLGISTLAFTTSLCAETLKPVLDFNFQNVIKNKINNVSGKGPIGTASGKITIVDDDKFGKCMKFSHRFISIPSAELPSLDKNFTISLNAKIDFFKNWQVIVAKESWAAKTGWLIMHVGEKLQCFANSSEVFSLKSPFLDKKWHNLAVVFNDAKITVYVDGEKLIEKDIAPKANQVPLYFGARHKNDGTGHADVLQQALMTKIKVFDKALSENEVKELVK